MRREGGQHHRLQKRGHLFFCFVFDTPISRHKFTKPQLQTPRSITLRTYAQVSEQTACQTKQTKLIVQDPLLYSTDQEQSADPSCLRRVPNHQREPLHHA
jgi:hypothetical protein